MKKGIIILTIIIGMMLLFDNVKAEQIVVPVVPRSNEYYFGIPNWSGGWSLDGNGNFAKNTIWAHDYVQEQWLQFSATSFTTDVDYIEFSIIASEPDTVATTDTASYRYCNNFTCMQYCASGACTGMCEKYTCSSYTTYSGDTITTTYESDLNDYTFYAELENTNGGKPMCTMSGKNTILCPTNHLQPYKLHLYFYFNTTINTNFDIEISRHARGYFVQNQQAIIDNQNQNTQQILEQNATYSDTPSKDTTNETQQLEDYEQAEQNLLNSLDLNMSVMDGITINPNASGYIWQIVDRLRQINPAIVLLMTSILGMGVIKMVLNR